MPTIDRTPAWAAPVVFVAFLAGVIANLVIPAL